MLLVELILWWIVNVCGNVGDVYVWLFVLIECVCVCFDVYVWFGNICELCNVLECVCLFVDDGMICVEYLLVEFVVVVVVL